MSVLGIISLITTIAPKLIDAGAAIYGIWKDAGELIGHAEANGGQVDPAAYAALVAKCEAAVKVLEDRAEEAGRV